MAGELSVVKLLEAQKVLGLEMALKLRQSSWSSGVFTIGVENKAREGIPKLQCSYTSFVPSTWSKEEILFITQMWRNCPLCSHWVGAYCIKKNSKSKMRFRNFVGVHNCRSLAKVQLGVYLVLSFACLVMLFYMLANMAADCSCHSK
jgi:hypothetical protein